MVKIVLTGLAECESKRQELPGIVKDLERDLAVVGRVTSINVRKVPWKLDEMESLHARRLGPTGLRSVRTGVSGQKQTRPARAG